MAIKREKLCEVHKPRVYQRDCKKCREGLPPDKEPEKKIVLVDEKDY